MHHRADREDENLSASWKDGGFSVWRLDDNNNEFLVRDGLTEDEALALVREYEGRGHRQAYWVRRGSGASDA
ncbi:MAG: hypothetical protein AB7D27_13180 [Desulfomicrobium sp.]